MTSALAPLEALRIDLEHLLSGENIEARAAERVFELLLGESTPAALRAAVLTALRAKGETAEELAGFARGLLARTRRVPRRAGPCIDTAGTGGDGRQSFNFSTAAALLVAAMGIPVAKHGNRAVSSRSGSADLIEALGLAFPAEPERAADEFAQNGFVFLFAPHFHPALGTLAVLRRELGIRTIFNLLGPLVNPARPSHQLIGAPSPALALRLARAAGELGLERVFVVHGDGFDEATPCGPFRVFACAGRTLTERVYAPEEFGLQPCSPAALAGGDARENAERLERLFAGREGGPLADAVCLNAALVQLLIKTQRDPRRALLAARTALEDGCAARFLEHLRTEGRP